MRVSSTILILVGAVLLPYSCEKTEEDENETLITTITDYDGNTYHTIKIGDQWWMAHNLETTHYADGTEIPLVESLSRWDTLGSEDKAFCYYNNNDNGEARTYGALYTWAAALNSSGSSDNNPSGIQGVCPDGWHMPGDSEWKELEMYLGMTQADADANGPRGISIGSKLAKLHSLWSDGILETSDQFGTSGFMALPGGGRRYDGTFGRLGENANFWSATEHDTEKAWGRHIYSKYTTVHRYSTVKSDGFSVRCVKDN